MICKSITSSEIAKLPGRVAATGLSRHAVIILATLALSACVGSGTSTFLDNAKQKEITAAKTDVAMANDAAPTPLTPNSVAYADQAMPGKALSLLPTPSNEALVIHSTETNNGDPAAVAASTNGLPGRGNPLFSSPNPAERRLASLDLQQSNDTGISIGISSTPLIDVKEYAAAFRVPILYASIKHGKCKGNWSPKPKRVEAKRINPGDPYYMEIRMRNTPLMPVGHTFIAYGKLDGNGEPLDERMIMLAPLGGYVGASLAAALPVPGVLVPYGDDCRIRPETAYRISLNAQHYEKLLLELRKVKKEKPVYSLFAQNCNYMIMRLAKTVGIQPPKNPYVPAIDFLYDMIEANEGIKIDRRYRSKIAGFPDWPQPKSKKTARN